MIWTKGTHQNAKFQTLTTHVEFHHICTLIGSFSWVYIKFQLKKSIEELCLIKHWRVMQNLKKNWFVVSKMTMFSLKKVQRSYLSWHWRVIQKLKKNYFVVLKMTWEISQIFTRPLKSLKIGSFMGSFNPKLKKYEPKVYRGVMCHENKNWCKVWSGTDLLFQNWHEEFDEFWHKHSKVPEICPLMGSFWTKYEMFALKRYRGVIFHDTEEWCKTWRKTDLWFGK